MVVIAIIVFLAAIILFIDLNIKYQTMGIFLLMATFLTILGVPELSKFLSGNRLEIEVMIFILLFPINLNLLNIYIKARKKV